MNLKSLRQLMDDFGRYLDNYSPSATNAEKNTQLNWAHRVLGKKLWLYDPRMTFNIGSTYAETGTNNSTYNIRSTTVCSRIVNEPLSVTISGNVLLDYEGKPGLWSMSQLNNVRQGWRTESAGTPYVPVYLGNGKMLLSPPPSSAGSNNFIEGTYIPADMTSDTSEPDIPVELHECLAYFAAQHVGLPSVTEGSQWQLLAAYNAEWTSLVMETAKLHRNAISGPWTDAGWAYPKFLKT